MAKDQIESGDEATDPFWLREVFQDPQGIFDTKRPTLAEVKSSCIIALDANVLLLPYKLGAVDLGDVIKVLSPLVDQKRLIIPAQAAREFAKNRAQKVADIVKYLRDEASLSGPVLGKRVGALSGEAKYEALRAEVAKVSNELKKVSKAINELADEIAAGIGEDPVSIAYRELFPGVVVADPESCSDKTSFEADMNKRYAMRRPPGYKDKAKADGGSGDLILWKTILDYCTNIGKDCIFVTADEKSDWYVQSNGPFQPRLELLEEYRAHTNYSLHIVPLSTLLKLFEAPESTVEEVRKAEGEQEISRNFNFETQLMEQEISSLQMQCVDLRNAMENIDRFLASLPPLTGNTSLPWERAGATAQAEREVIRTRLVQLERELMEVSGRRNAVAISGPTIRL